MNYGGKLKIAMKNVQNKFQKHLYDLKFSEEMTVFRKVHMCHSTAQSFSYTDNFHMFFFHREKTHFVQFHP